MYKSFCEHIFTFLLGRYPGIQLLSHMVNASLTVRDCPDFQSFPKRLDHFDSHQQQGRILVAPYFPPTSDVVFFYCSQASLVKLLSRVRLFATPWTIAYHRPPSMGFSRQEYRNGLPFPSPGDLPNPGIEPRSPALQSDTLPSEPPGKPFTYLSPPLPECGD